MVDRSIHRCAIYTRKSHEDGLDQTFNSLDAQHESCKAYITSQTGLGWKLRDKPYDDGGISGGHMDRPGLQTLIKDIKAGLVDIIVVYKVDRLTRSLTDFAKLVDIFDEHDVSFVSVTQAFNTTTSMGRLTLNVLLSFAQFEREVTAERIRDKIAASKKKGMWMGGTVPFGYDNQDRLLHIVEKEAQSIRTLFDLYVQHKNVRVVKIKADDLSLVSRLRIHKSGKRSGGKSFTRGHIHAILTNPIYVGQIQHKSKIYEGNHEPIITTSTWEQVQLILQTNAVKRTTYYNKKSPALLADLLFDADGDKLVSHHANKKGTRYHYYVSQKLNIGDQDTGWRIPFKTIESIIQNTLIRTFGSKTEILALLPIESRSAKELQDIITQAKELGREIKNADHLSLKALYSDLIKRITLETNEISISFNLQFLKNRLAIQIPDDVKITLIKPMTIRRRGQEMKMLIGGQSQQTPNLDPALIKLVAKAHLLRIELETGSAVSIKNFAIKYGMDHGDAKNLLPLSYLAPNIVEDILAGNQPVDLTARRLKYISNLPLNWIDQRQFLGFN